MIVEFSFNYNAKGKNKPNGPDKNMFLEEFPIPLVRGANDFYLSLQAEDEFVDLKTAKTKTEFAYISAINGLPPPKPPQK